MKDFATELLREKFVIHDPAANLKDGKGPTIALSNRIEVPLNTDKGEIQENLVVRAHNMPLAVRMASRLIQSYTSGGPILDRNVPFDWEAAWDVASGDYEQMHNPQRWIAVYNKGKVVFEKGHRHAMLDIIENCNVTTKGKYEEAIALAESVVRKTGRVVRIEYDANVALNVNLERRTGRIGVILRAPDKTTTFNYSVAGRLDHLLNIPQCLGAASAFLEGIQLAFMIGMNQEKIRRGLLPRGGKEDKQAKEATIRLSRLNAEITNLEASCEVRYRPERPDFHDILADAEAFARKVLPKPSGKK
jgi:hypothetical protein